MYAQRPQFGAHGTSPPNLPYQQNPFRSPTGTMSQALGNATTDIRRPSERYNAPPLPASVSDPANVNCDHRDTPAICIRRLPRSTGDEALRSMFIFAVDLIDTEFVTSQHPEDRNFATAIARFGSQTGAYEAQEKLNGKLNATKEATMVVEVITGGIDGALGARRNTIDGDTSPQQTSSSSSGGSMGAPPRHQSRFNSTFQSPDLPSPPLTTSNSTGSGDFPMPESGTHFQSLFSPQSPLANGFDHRNGISGKSVINDDVGDDETGELLKDPVAYAKSGQQTTPRRPTNPQIPVARFGSLSLTTSGSSGNVGSPHSAAMTSPRSGIPLQSPVTAISPTGVPMSPNNGFLLSLSRHQYPPVNPADQNPPCNTLYVGNLPIDTSEDELKAMFSKQRGYKRLCFRTKQNGPMCFVEFEDVSFATKALNELYGHPLHNSVKGGIRLSFSKNPLGVRARQANGLGPATPMTPQAMAPGFGGLPNGGYFSISGPPPGLAAPPGLMSAPVYPRSPPVSTGMDGMFSNPFAMPTQDYSGPMSPRTMSGGVPTGTNGATFERDMRSPAGFSDYMLGR